MTSMEISNNFILEEEKKACRESRVRQLREERQKQQAERIQRLREAEKLAHERREKTLREIRERLAAKHREVEERRQKAMERRSSSKAEQLQAWRKGIAAKLDTDTAPPKPNRLAGLRGRPGSQFVSMTTSWAPDSRPRSATGRLFGFGSSAPRSICEREDSALKRRISQQPVPLSNNSHKVEFRAASAQPTSNNFGMNPRMCQSIHISRPSRMMEMSFMGNKTKLEKKRIEPPEKISHNGNNLRQSMDNLLQNNGHSGVNNRTSGTSKSNTVPPTPLNSSRVMSQSMLNKNVPDKNVKKKTARQPPDLVISTEGATLVNSNGNNSPISPSHMIHHNGLPASPLLSRDTSANNDEDLYRAKLAEQRRLAREKREKEKKAAEEAEEAEKTRLRELQEQRIAAEKERRRAELAELKRIEEEHLREEEEEERRKKEERDRQREKEMQEEKEKVEREKLVKIQRQEEEREERKRKLELIMSRVKDSHSPAGDLSPKRPLSPLIVGTDASLPTPSIASVGMSSLVPPSSSQNNPPLSVTSPLEPPKFRSPLLQSMLGSGKLNSSRITLPSQTNSSGATSPSDASSQPTSQEQQQLDEKEKEKPLSDNAEETVHHDEPTVEKTETTESEIATPPVIEIESVKEANEDTEEPKSLAEEVEEVSAVSGSTTEEPVIKEEGDDFGADDSMKIHDELSDEELPAIEEESESEIAAEEAM